MKWKLMRGKEPPSEVPAPPLEVWFGAPPGSEQ